MCWKEEEEAKQNFLLLGSFSKETPTPHQPQDGGQGPATGRTPVSTKGLLESHRPSPH